MTLLECVKSRKYPWTLTQWHDAAEKAGIHVSLTEELSEEAFRRILSILSPGCQAPSKVTAGASVSRTEELLCGNLIFLEDSSLLHPMGLVFLKTAEDILRRHNRTIPPEKAKKLHLPYSADKSIRKALEMAHTSIEHSVVKQLYQVLLRLLNDGLLELHRMDAPSASPVNDNAPSILLPICDYHRTKKPILMITQDEHFAADILSLNEQRSTCSKHKITVQRLGEDGCLEDIPLSQTKLAEIPVRVAHPSALSLMMEARREPDRCFPEVSIPVNGDTVYTDRSGQQAVLLGEKLGKEGSEGTVYRVHQGDGTTCAAKIYHSSCRTHYRLEKLTRMLSLELRCEGICFPTALLYDKDGNFVGYLMEEARGEPFSQTLFAPHRFAAHEHLKSWKKKDFVECALYLLHKLRYLQDHNLLLGDINQDNFLLDTAEPGKVFLVDIDSCQVGDLPALKGSDLFTAPELHQQMREGKVTDYAQIMRTVSSENFAIATVLFMMLMYGKAPYAHAKGGSTVDNILEGHFPYALGKDIRTDRAPLGKWAFYWSHLDWEVKKAFQRTFTRFEGNSPFNVKERLTVSQWISVLENYYARLESTERDIADYCVKHHCTVEDMEETYVLSPDWQTVLAMPERLKRSPNVVKEHKRYLRCRQCRKELLVAEACTSVLCKACREASQATVTTTCLHCGKEFTAMGHDSATRPLLCPDCYGIRDTTVEIPCETRGCTHHARLTVWNHARQKAEGKRVFCSFCKAHRTPYAHPADPTGSKKRLTSHELNASP